VRQALPIHQQRRYGGRVDYYRLLGSDTNIESGVREIDRLVIPVPRAVILPTRVRREAEKSISVISANKKFVQGGGYDVGVKQFILRGSLLSSINGVRLDDWIVFNNRRFNIVEFDEYEFQGSYLITAREVKGTRPHQVFNVSATETIKFEGSTNVG
jgi:hypothetical protein